MSKLMLMLERESGAFESAAVDTIESYGGFPVLQRVAFLSAPCAIHKLHQPMPASTELHHVFPLELQKRIWPTVTRDDPQSVHDRTLVPLCGSGHSDVHIALDALLRGEKPSSIPGIGRTEAALAREAHARFLAAGGVL